MASMASIVVLPFGPFPAHSHPDLRRPRWRWALPGLSRPWIALPFIPWIDGHRARRVGELLAVVWLLSLADLFFTIWAHLFTPFIEMNPIAAQMLAPGRIPVLIGYKILMTLGGSLIFWRLRDHGRAEIALWATACTYVLLAIRWSDYTLAAMTP